MTKRWVTYLNNLDSDNGMHRHHVDDMTHLPHCLHHPSGDVALPLYFWLAVHVAGVVSSRLWLGMAMGIGGSGDLAVAVGIGDGGWQVKDYNIFRINSPTLND